VEPTWRGRLPPRSTRVFNGYDSPVVDDNDDNDKSNK
jgi:hypothetical protein